MKKVKQTIGKNTISNNNYKKVQLPAAKTNHLADLSLLSNAELQNIFETIGKIKTAKDTSTDFIRKIEHYNKFNSEPVEEDSKILVSQPSPDINYNDCNNYTNLNQDQNNISKLTKLPASAFVPDPIKPILTMAEKKRLQWEREKAENDRIGDYNPWGRVGAGAPIKDQAGNTINDYSTIRKNVSKSVQLTDNGLDHSQKKPNTNYTNLNDNYHQESNANQYNNYHANPANNITPAHNNSTQEKQAILDCQKIKDQYNLNIHNQQASNFTNTNNKNDRNMQWLEDLENQRQEQKLRKENEKKFLREANQDNMTWMDKMLTTPSNKSSNGRVMSYNSATNQNISPAMTYKQSNNQIPAPSLNNEVTVPQVQIYGRRNYDEFKEYGVPQPVEKSNMLEAYHVEQEAKRKKLIQHQEDLKQQIEDNKRRKELEKEKYYREDAKIFGEPAVTAEVTKTMEPVVKTTTRVEGVLSKEEKERILFDGLLKAREDAEREKHEKYAKKKKVPTATLR